MASTVTSSAFLETDLLERIQYAAELAEACHLVLEEVFRTSDFEHAVVVVRHGEALRAVGHGVADERLRALTSPGSLSTHRLRDLLDGGDQVTIPGADLPELGFVGVCVVPLAGPRGVPAAALLLDDPTRSGPGALSSVVRPTGPILSRLLEIELLRGRVDEVSHHSMLMAAIVDTLADPVILTDHDNSFLFANRRAEHLFSASPDDNEGRRRAVRVNDLLFSSFLTQAVISGGETRSRELNLVNPSDGSDLLFEVFSIPLPKGTGRQGAVISVLRDISDLKRALAELELQFSRSRVAEQRASRETARLNAILANVSDPILVTNVESKIVLMNTEAERLFESSLGEGRDLDWARAVRTNDTKFTTLIADFLLQDRTRRTERLALHDPLTGRELPIEVKSSKILSSRRETTAIVSVLHDLTPVVENERLARELQILNEGLEERVRLSTEELEERNRQLEWQSRELQKASRLKSEFLASMSHELRTPINAILGYTSLLRERIFGDLTEKQENALRKISGASQHLLALINDILDLSRIEAGKMRFRIEPVSLNAIVSELSQAIEPMIREKRLAYKTEVSEDIPLLLNDRTKLKQVLLNLLSNAVKFTHEGSVTLRAMMSPAGEHFRIEVEDTGIGIAEPDLEAIFDDFRQVDQSATRQYGGTGLGLSITRKLVTLMKGSIRVDSRYGTGSTFFVELPLQLSADTGDAGSLMDIDVDVVLSGESAPWEHIERQGAVSGELPSRRSSDR